MLTKLPRPGAILLLGVILMACEFQTAPRPDTTPDSAATGAPLVTPTVVSAPALLEQAMAARAIGDIERAATDLSTLLNTYPDSPEVYQARYYLAESFARRGRWNSAIETFKQVLTEAHPEDDPLAARALFWLARGYEEAGDWAAAVAHYEQYRALGTALEPYAAMRQAAQLRALGQLDEAAQLYEYSATSAVHPGEQAGSLEKAIGLRRELGQDDRALQLYEQLLAMAENAGYRARMLTEAVALARNLGREDQARSWLLEIVNQAPATPQAVAAVDQLLAAGDPALPAAAAARVYFFNEAYAAALPQFDAALEQVDPAAAADAQTLELQRMRGLTLRALGYFPEALDALAAAGAVSPDSEPGRQARLDWIQTLGQSGEVQQAADRYRTYADTYPDDARAPTALDRAAQLLDRLGQQEQAAQVRLALAQRYPDSELAGPAAHAVALGLFQAGRWNEARQAWQLVTEHGPPIEQARAAFWAARAARQQQAQDQARTLFEQAYAAAPDSYYGARAADELNLTFEPVTPLHADLTGEDWQSLETWVTGWAQPPDAAGDTPQGEPEQAATDTVARAVELAQVGLWTEALGEWHSARTSWAEHPQTLLYIAHEAHTHAVPYIALKAAEQLAVRAPQSAQPVPDPLRRLIFPAPYSDLVTRYSREYDIDPRLLYALLRQESLFNPQATSWVGARGLAQVMPATGSGIAQNLGMHDFQPQDLYHPFISIRFGAFYIGSQIRAMNGSIHAGLAAYNGGPGNAQRWAGGTTVADPDLFVESIDYFETRQYVRLVYGYYSAYQRLYHLDASHNE